jgi:uncharacterized protein
MDLQPDATTSIGRVVRVSGSTAILRLDLPDRIPQAAPTVGSLVGIASRDTLVIGVITELQTTAEGGAPAATCTVNLMGEVALNGVGQAAYKRGITSYPSLGNKVLPLDPSQLELILTCPGENVIHVGSLQQDETLPVHIKVDELIKKHFAVLGSTGVGKSSGVAVIVDQIIKVRPDLRIFFIDPHNEYGTCFGDRAEIMTPRNLQLPFWLFNFEEFVDVLFRGRPGVEDEIDILAELIPLAKSMFDSGRNPDRSALKRFDTKVNLQSANTPVPYRLTDLIALIEERRGKLENRSLVLTYSRLLSRIETVRADTRYGFMFDAAATSSDTMATVLGDLFRLPMNGKPMTIMQLAGFPAEVVDCIVSVLCRMGFELGLWSDGSLPTLFLCEEAHRYAPADRTIGFGPTRKALSRIAKEGRKYGIYLGLVTQRPAELDATIVSQCSTVFAMRMANERDQAILRAAASDAASSLLQFIPSLGVREAFAFGEGVPLPTRLRFTQLPADQVPRSDASGYKDFSAETGGRTDMLSIVRRWRDGGAARPSEPEIAAYPGPVADRFTVPVFHDTLASPLNRPAALGRGFGAR